MLIVDAHLDLAYNALRGRDVCRPALEQAADEEGIPTVGLPDLRDGGVGLICPTIFCEPLVLGKTEGIGSKVGYRTPDEARAAGLAQLRWYQEREAACELHLVRSREGLPGDDVLQAQSGDDERTPDQRRSGSAPVGSENESTLRGVLLLEGADPLRDPSDVAEWHAAGLRMVGLAWRQTRYAGGTGAPGPLTAAGVDLVRELDRFGIIHDVSHLAEESFWQLLNMSQGPIVASHSNCRSMVPTDRQLSDEMIRAIVRREGVIGINFFDKFLLRPEVYKTRRATLADVVAHVRHICDLAGDTAHVGLGTDMDGGLGREQIPEEIVTSADLPKVAHALRAGGFTEADVRGIVGGNWLRFFRRVM